MNLRNQLLALFLLLVFIAGGFLLFRTWVVQKPFGIILFVGDGLVTGNLTAARLYDGGAVHHLTMETLPHLALVSNYANDFAVPDAPAAATAIATGVKVDNGTLGVNAKGRALQSILELAKQHGRAVGIVTTGELTDAAIAAFYAHEEKSGNVDDIAVQFAEKASLDVAMGGGAQDFTPESKSGHRKDGRDLLLEMKSKGAEIMRSKAELENAPIFTTAPRVGIFANADLAYSNQIQPGSQEPTLPDMVRRAIEFLQVHERGYLLVVDAELISRAAETNDGEHVLTETVDMDRALATALRYSGENSVVIAAGLHATGGMTMNGYPLRQEHGVGLLGVNALGYPAICWATGPNGPQKSGTGSPAPQADSPAAYYVPAAIDSAQDVIAIGKGPGTDALKGFIDNTEIFQILAGQL
ncbi:MAG TPA: alkaline phosphatase [Chthoniobacteraceae bacterium]|jgi:alkaline phosphatase|nr:alkaline phosphatase [Chthoniobacteraceae bacterium]